MDLVRGLVDAALQFFSMLFSIYFPDTEISIFLLLFIAGAIMAVIAIVVRRMMKEG